LNQTGSPFHSVSAIKAILTASGFEQISLGDCDFKVTLKRGKKYFFTHDHSEIMAFAVGEKFNEKGKGGIVMIGAHTDSPCLKIRRNFKQQKSGMEMIGVTTYGGGIWHTWTDRPLGFGGKVVVSTAEGGLEERLVKFDSPMCFIPNLAIHLQTADERKNAADLNTENQLVPVFSTKESFLALLAAELKTTESQIVDFDLCLFDANPASLVGSEFVSSGRIDNQLSCFAAFEALSDFSKCLAGSEDICIAAAFNHEEVGSNSVTGADSNLPAMWIKRILSSFDADETKQQQILSRSVLVSADCAHGIHPNFPQKHQDQHKVALGKGIVIKMNENQRYSTSCVTASITRELLSKANIPVQDFIVRNDSPCGSTIGPMLSSILGVKAIDIGAPQWAMHSCRESCHTSDIDHLTNACHEIYKTWRKFENHYKAI
jgi:aspartyl aminopeptidase